jgi:hypothetical protein
MSLVVLIVGQARFAPALQPRYFAPVELGVREVFARLHDLEIETERAAHRGGVLLRRACDRSER